MVPVRRGRATTGVSVKDDPAQAKAQHELEDGDASQDAVPELERANVCGDDARSDDGVARGSNGIVDVRECVARGEGSDACAESVVDNWTQR